MSGFGLSARRCYVLGTVLSFGVMVACGGYVAWRHFGPNPLVVCSSMRFDAGAQPIGAYIEHAFSLRNAGGAVLHITDVKPGCSCTQAWASREQIPPGEEGFIKARVHVELLGRQSREIAVRTNDPRQSYVRLVIAATGDVSLNERNARAAAGSSP